MIVAIDGTGSASPSDYAREMDGSFCSQIGRTANATYFRGPTLIGSETSTIANLAADAVIAARGKPWTGPVMLAGFSRGGCAAIIAARRLKDRGVEVHSLFLFDAVDMQISDMHLSQIISDNVRMVAHARSARNLAFWIRNPVQSRFYFYNTGRYLAGSGSYETKSFVGSHGAVGGLPSPDIKEDAGCVLAVAEWMNKQFENRGLTVTLKPSKSN
jgi:pimeloyl-ACP methyl ester carboxylesterase